MLFKCVRSTTEEFIVPLVRKVRLERSMKFKYKSWVETRKASQSLKLARVSAWDLAM